MCYVLLIYVAYHEVIHYRVMLNCLWCHANTNHGAPISMEGKEGLNRNGGQVAIDTSRAPVVVQQAPYERLAKVGAGGPPKWVLFAVQVEDDH